ncbi:tRNA methyltransferase complex GCD14 subunit [Delitschia confertaspora ATCC 74209]|uniref:tRNA (adenine(58)-N(1))-methyltransferase catalytic subunit TRM61 n=1 Tax=Delitschia confertaspora ATCC 74209 TaxID=1513339 RepID=A0A9P4JSA1_9PLEO|nr:tRNA methyltransferase complex GCD14 subunit [Delitschia confertaspora ATCC 74209]
MAHRPCPFFDPGTQSSNNTLGILQLKRDLLIPTILSSEPSTDYAEGKVETTRFGTFPHSTLINQPWGTQVLASVVDTGSRGAKGKKRKRGKEEAGKEEEEDEGRPSDSQLVKAATASSGFVHLIPPTPETWTLCLPHRTQVVYTPDYSYILQRLRARPGDHIIEAGAGSGSFTHAAARAVFNGYLGQDVTRYGTEDSRRKRKTKRYGRVYSFEYHEQRAKQLVAEVESHGLRDVVTITNRDVYGDGFCLPSSNGPAAHSSDAEPDADIIFLDLPAPWLALKHLTRSPLPSPTATPAEGTTPTPFRSPLNPKSATRICTFSPCIEQVQKTITALREYGWLEISMVEIQAKRLDVRRERVGLSEEGVRGANSSAATVKEAVQRLRDVEGRAKLFHGMQIEKQKEVMRKVEKVKKGEQEKKGSSSGRDTDIATEKRDAQHKINAESKDTLMSTLPPSKHDRLQQAKANAALRPAYKEGRLIHRTEQEIKTHTSYLTFAVLPREWTKEDEEQAREKWGR